MSASTPKLYTITVGPITSHGTPAQVRRSEQRIKREMDELIREYWQVGKRNRCVKTEVVEG